jgi:hypothetical protein
MKRTILGLVVGVAALGASTAAMAHVDVALGVEVPGAAYAPVQPAYDAPPPVAYAPPPAATLAWRGDDDWREHRWREHERREHQWREHEWHEREWHDRGRWDN